MVESPAEFDMSDDAVRQSQESLIEGSSALLSSASSRSAESTP